MKVCEISRWAAQNQEQGNIWIICERVKLDLNGALFNALKLPFIF